MFSTEVQNKGLELFFDHVAKKEAIYQESRKVAEVLAVEVQVKAREVEMLAAKVKELENELAELKKTVTTKFILTDNRATAMSLAYGCIVSEIKGCGFVVFASSDDYEEWLIKKSELLAQYPTIGEEKPASRVLYRGKTEKEVKKLAPWAKFLAQVKEGFIAFPTKESFLHWKFFCRSHEHSAGVAFPYKVMAMNPA